MKSEMLNVYYDVSYYLEKAEENLRNAENILRQDLLINKEGYRVEDIANFRQVLVNSKDDIDYKVIPAINNMEE